MTGIINLYKPSGITSFGAVAAVRKLFGERRCGHGGTLDPEASGVLPVLLGKATRLSDVFLGMRKTYESALRFGCSYDTGDVWGKVTEAAGADHEKLIRELSPESIGAVLPRFTGTIVQLPPAYSALKIGGVPAYKLARKGETPGLKPREVNVYGIELTGFTPSGAEGKPAEVSLRVECGRGTYIRTLCCDIAAALGLPGAMSSLRRVSYGPLDAGNAVSLEELTEYASAKNGAALTGALLPCDVILGDFPELRLSRERENDYFAGRPVYDETGLPDGALAKVLGDDGSLLGVGRVDGGVVKSKISLI